MEQAGVAQQAAERFPHLREVWGRRCRAAYDVARAAPLQEYINSSCLVRFDTTSRCVLFPTKPLDVYKPAFSWRLPADLNLISQSVDMLDALRDSLQIGLVALPLVGCGAGGLQRHEVLPLLERLDDNFTLVEQR